MKFSKRMEDVKPSDIRETMKLIAANPGTISFAGGLPDPKLFPNEEIKKATDTILEENADVALQYGLTRGNVELREEIVKLMKREGVETNVDNICITTGSQQGINLAGMLFLDEGDIIFTENPSYLGAFAAFNPFGPKFIGVDGDEDGMDMEKLEDAINRYPTGKIIYIIPNFQNPTGRTWSEEKRREVLKIAEKYDLVILEDNAYGEVRFEGTRIPSIKSMDKNDRVVYFGSFSKILSPGMRVGWTCGSLEVINKYELLKNAIDLQSAELAQIQIARYLKNNDLDQHLSKINEVYKSRRDLMIKTINEEFPAEAKYYYPEGGMFVWVELPDYINTRDLLKKAIERKVAFVPGGSFYPMGDCESSMRINFSTMEADKIVEGIKTLGQLLKEEIK